VVVVVGRMVVVELERVLVVDDEVAEVLLTPGVVVEPS
jgi:hypothetical protein